MATALQDPMKSEAWPLCWKCKIKQKSKIPQIEMDQQKKAKKLRQIYKKSQKMRWLRHCKTP